jgi:hypothetical protein
MAQGKDQGAIVSVSKVMLNSEWLNEEPYTGKPCVRFCEGVGRRLHILLDQHDVWPQVVHS